MSIMKGIDVSEHNGTLDWASLKKAGVQFAVIRAGIGIHASSGMREDKQFRANIKGCEQNNIPYGLYFFCYSLNIDEVKKECEYMKSLIMACKNKPFCVAYDFEGDTIVKGKNNGVSLGATEFNLFTLEWNKYFSKLGYKTPVYLNKAYYTGMYDKSKLGSYPLWPAYYQNSCFVNTYGMWQFSNAYNVCGKNFDGDIASSDFIIEVTKTNKDGDDVQTYTNKSSRTYCYADTTKKIKVGYLLPGEKCECLGKAGSMYIVRYNINGNSNSYKVGLVDYNGGTKY